MIEREWEKLSIAELHRFDALCDRFERALIQDPSTRIELFIADLPEPQQRLIARELIPMEIERRRSIGESVGSDEFASRFPAWADELRELATQCIEELSQSPASESESDTIDEKADSETRSDTKRNNLQIQGGQPWAVSSEFARHFNLPSDGVLGHYRLLSVIGRGGMGLVVRAHDTRLTRDVAIKFFYTPLHHDDRTRERFLREAQSAAVIRHRHVVTIYAVDEVDRTPFLVMELVEGTTLEGYLRQSGRLATNEVVSFACQLAEGLAAAHKQGLIHRDIKPANILLDNTSGVPNRVRSLSDWNIKLTDFGLARIAADVQLTDSGVIVGTPQYMSPEQANGQDIDCRSDLFSLGSVMYAMCTGQPAFLADAPLGILRQVAEKPPRPIREVSPQTPFWLIEIIDKLMAKSPSDRFQSADELVQKLSHHINVSLLGHSEPVAKPARDSSLRRLVLGLVIGSCFAAVIAGVIYFRFARKATVRFEVNDPKIQVTIAGDDVSITDGNADYRVAAGDLDLSVTYGELEFTTKDFHLSQGEYVRLRVTYLDKQLSVERDGHELWTGMEKSDESAVVKSSMERSSRHVWPSDAPAPAIIPFTPDEAKRHQEEWASHLGISVEFENTIGMKFRVIPPGEF